MLLPEWKYVCVGVDPLAGGLVTFFMDGQFVASRLVKELSSNYSRRLDVAQLNINVKYGSVGLINVFNGVESGNLSSPPAALTSCGTPGTALTWAPSSWIYPQRWPLSPVGVNSLTKQVAASEVCRSNKKNISGVLVVVPLYLKVAAAYSVCSRLGSSGQIPIYDNLTEWRAAWEFAAAAIVATTTVEFLWQPFHRQPGNIFVSRYNASRQINPAMWFPGQPNNPDEKCVLCDWHGCLDKYCDDEQPFVCQFSQESPPLLRLRGLCRQTSLDTMYYPTNRLGDLVWVGLGATYIRFNHQEQRWEARMSGIDAWAVSDASYESLLLGTQNWTIFDDRKCFPGRSFGIYALQTGRSWLLILAEQR
jgi:hypothetical protein